MLPIVLATIVAPFIGAALAKPEQIRAVSDPIFHYYLQSYPQNSMLHSIVSLANAM